MDATLEALAEGARSRLPFWWMRQLDVLERQLHIAMSRRDMVAAIVIAQRIASL